MRSWKQRLDKEVEEGKIRRPTIFVPKECEVEVWVESSDGIERQLSLLDADSQGLISCFMGHFGHGWMPANMKIFVHQSCVNLWIKPKDNTNEDN